MQIGKYNQIILGYSTPVPLVKMHQIMAMQHKSQDNGVKYVSESTKRSVM
jgi:hypothetical protein